VLMGSKGFVEPHNDKVNSPFAFQPIQEVPPYVWGYSFMNYSSFCKYNLAVVSRHNAKRDKLTYEVRDISMSICCALYCVIDITLGGRSHPYAVLLTILCSMYKFCVITYNDGYSHNW
jgi:hypothetical protein